MQQAATDLFPSEWPEPPKAPAAVSFVVYGTPGPQGSKKFLGTFTGKDGRSHARMGESSALVAPWREAVSRAAREARDGRPPMDGPLLVSMVFTLTKPATLAKKRKRTYPQSRPDLSKLARSTEDALVEAGLIQDDSRIVGYSRLAKVFPNEDPDALEASGVKIEIRMLGVS